MNRIVAVLLLAGSFVWNALGGNAIFNGDFRLGTEGFGVWRLLRRDTNPEQTFLPLRAEKEGIALDNPYGEYFQLIPKEFFLPAGKHLLQTELAGPAGARVGVHIFYIDKRVFHLVGRAYVTLNGSRQSCELPFATPDQSMPYLLVVFPLGKVAPTGTFHFYSFKLDGAEPPPLAAALRADKPLFILGKDEGQCRIQVKLANATGVAQRGTLAFEIIDSARGTVVAREESQLELAPGSTEREFPFPLKKYGAFTARVRWNGAEIPAVNAHFACVGEYHGPARINPSETFCVGIDGTALFEKFRGGTLGGYIVRGITQETRFRNLAAMGCRLFRDWGGCYLTQWADLEPEEGKFDFSAFDYGVDMIRRNGMEILPCFGRMYEIKNRQDRFRPDWLQPKLITIEKNPPGTNPKFVVKVPPMPIWRRYVEAFVKHAGERISMYEIMNEPNLNISPELYLKYMIPAAEIIRKEAPHATILGICGTGDMGTIPNNFMRKCTKLGALKYLDGVSFHPYDARELNSITSADAQIADLRKIVGDKPLYNTELYFLYDSSERDAWKQMHPKAWHGAWRFLVDLGEGLKASTSIWELSLYCDGLHLAYPQYKTDMVPNELFATYNALARHFEGAKCIRKLRFANDVICYVYRKDGQPIAAIWNYTGKSGVRADLSAFEVMDLFGNPENAGEKPITEAPFYLKPGQLAEAEFVKRLESLALRVEHPSASRVARLVDGQLHVTLSNTAETAQEGKLGISGGGFSALNLVPFTLPGKSSRNIAIPVKSGKAALNEKPELMLFTNGTTFHLPLEVISNPLLDSEFQMKNAKGTVELQSGKLIVKMDVQDATNAGTAAGRLPWQTDCVELFIDPAPFRISETHPHNLFAKPEASQLFITPRDQQKLSGKGAIDPQTCKIEVEQTAAGYSVQLEIPVKNAGEAIGFCVKIDDAEGDRVQETVLGDVPEPYLHVSNFAIVKEKP